jgi:hypothetical protein
METHFLYFFFQASFLLNSKIPSLVCPNIKIAKIKHLCRTHLEKGIRMADGDGTVPLVSLGSLCRGSWREAASGLNPSAIPVITREYRNELNLDSNTTAPGHFNPFNPWHHFEKLRRFKR